MKDKTVGSRVFDVFNGVFLVMLCLVMIFPFYNIIVTSFITMGEYYATPLVLWPKEPTLVSYQYIFSTAEIPQALLITVVVTALGTLLSMAFTLMLAYGLSRDDLPGGKAIFRMVLITMFLDSGLIPYYLMVRNLGLTNSILANIIPVMISLWNFLVIRSFFRQLPRDLEEAALIDGATWLQLFVCIVLPISMPVIATFTLFYAVGYWNSWYQTMLFVSDRNLQTLQYLLRRMIVDEEKLWGMQESFAQSMGGRVAVYSESVQMAACVVAVVPIVCVYPFLQKYFVKGVMIGAIKG